jgi:galactose mutarotase-like enzyme
LPPSDSSCSDELTATLIRLQSDELTVDVLPGNGGRIASIRCRRSGTEFLLDGSRYNTKAQFPLDAPFEDSDCAGWDECLPTISTDATAPDHGDLWRHAWRIREHTGNNLLLTTQCSSRPLAFTRRLRLHASQIHLEYQIENLTSIPLPFLYASHPLFAVEPRDQIILPHEVRRLLLHYSRGNRIGHAGEWIDWPASFHGDQQIILNEVSKQTSGTAEMLYSGKLVRGIYALYRARRRQAIVMRFNSAKLPYLGLWLCNGGWPEEPAKRKQYAVAMEPTVAAHGSLAEAIASNEAPVLEPAAVYSFSLRIDVLGCDRPWTSDEVTHYVNETQAV